MFRPLIQRALLVMLCLGMFASTVHADAYAVCVDEPAVFEHGHADGDGDEVPADSGKAYPHHHSSCSGHHVVGQDAGQSDLILSTVSMIGMGNRFGLPPSHAVDPALRPPIA